jgi:hypothetical protein
MTEAIKGLHGFYQPAPPAWTPQTIGWYVVFAVAGLVVVWAAVHAVRQWIANRYRRAALDELEVTLPDGLSALLKRTALAAWPREMVASLTGPAWLEFLDRTGRQCRSFENEPGSRIEEIALKPDKLSADDELELRRMVREWIRRHRVQA